MYTHILYIHTQTQTHSLLGRSIFRWCRSMSVCELKEFKWKKTNVRFVNENVRDARVQIMLEQLTCTLLIILSAFMWKGLFEKNQNETHKPKEDWWSVSLGSQWNMRKSGGVATLHKPHVCSHYLVLRKQNIQNLFIRIRKISIK